MKCLSSLFGLLILLILASCKSEPVAQFVLPENASELIAGDDLKTWKLAKRYNDGTRMNMGYCFLQHRDTYRPDGSFQNNSEENPDCGESLLARWSIVQDSTGNNYIKLKSSQIPDLMGIEEDYKFFRVLNLAEDRMVLQYRHRQFSEKWRTIKDYWVREDVNVEDRDFHW